VSTQKLKARYPSASPSIKMNAWPSQARNVGTATLASSSRCQSIDVASPSIMDKDTTDHDRAGTRAMGRNRSSRVSAAIRGSIGNLCLLLSPFQDQTDADLSPNNAPGAQQRGTVQ